MLHPMLLGQQSPKSFPVETGCGVGRLVVELNLFIALTQEEG